MAKPVDCRIEGMRDGRFAAIAVLASGKVFRRVGLAILAEAEASVNVLAGLVAACGGQVVRIEYTPSPHRLHPGQAARPVRVSQPARMRLPWSHAAALRSIRESWSTE